VTATLVGSELNSVLKNVILIVSAIDSCL